MALVTEVSACHNRAQKEYNIRTVRDMTCVACHSSILVELKPTVRFNIKLVRRDDSHGMGKRLVPAGVTELAESVTLHLQIGFPRSCMGKVAGLAISFLVRKMDKAIDILLSGFMAAEA